MLQVLVCRSSPRAGVRGDDRVSRLRSRGGELGQTRAARVRAQAREHPQVPGLQVTVTVSAANRLIGEVVQSRRRPLLGPSPG